MKIVLALRNMGVGTRRRLTVAALCLFLFPPTTFLLLDFWFPFPTSSLTRPASRVVQDQDGQPLRMFISRDDRWRFPVTLEEVSPELLEALVASEDRWFCWHPGVNPVAILRAGWANLREGRTVSGASTIPMQIARMAEPKDRSFQSKIAEGFRALQLFRLFSRKELLEIYLNITPYGGNIEGVGAASYFYFGKRPTQLSLGEIALLTALPRSPTRYDPVRHPEEARLARDRVLHQLQDRGVFEPAEVQNALRQSIPNRKRNVPFSAPHFGRLLTELFPEENVIQSTLDRRVQAISEKQVSTRIKELRGRGIENSAVVVIENRTRSVRAMVGSADFFEASFQGQVNGAVARRSPGSALKPFLYASAFDQGKIVPESFLLDIPTNFSGYIAENYDGNYRGRIRADQALIHSLNASAVRLLAQTGLTDFHNLLKKMGLSSLDRPSGQYGLPLVLGAGEVRLLDLTNLYASLAEGGLHRPANLTLASSSSSTPPERVFSRESSFWVTEALKQPKRPDLPDAWELTREVPAVAWKTGTSYGHRDAWALGFSEHFTIGVWVGNFNGRGQKGISGATDAAPLLFDLFRAIEKGRARIPRPRGLEIARISVCSLSHQLPGPFCQKKEQLSYIPGTSRFRQCSFHRRIFVDAAKGTMLKGNCLSLRPHTSQVVEMWPSELVAWWRANGQTVQPLPQIDSLCRTVLSDYPPEIVSPDPSTPYRIRNDAPVEYQKIPLVVRTGLEKETVFWYQDGTLVGSGPPDQQHFLSPKPGTHRLVVVDSSGRSDEITYTVDIG